uniref:2Fe-2S iron-sulfur cluster binding domain-containing protein n=1 Tax=candidate division WOR-3 bacterium TaxID=2052148 RepID=A0A7C4XBJ6_UNCW3
MLKLIIDGKEIHAQKGETVLEVCRREGIYIPTLCYHENLTPYGGCRLCIVEVEGNPRPMTACTLPVQNGMIIKTDTPLLKELRKFTLQLILSEHPYSCLICDKKENCANYMECIEKEPITFGCKYCSKNGSCELQKLVEKFGIKKIPFTFRYRNLPIEDYDPFFERDYNLCVLCGRCVRACAELRHAYTIDFHHRGPKTLVGTAFNLPHIDADCQFCGVCVDVCPTGAMRERYNKYLGKCEKKVKTHCLLCSIGCALNIEINDDKIIRTTPDKEPLCVRGRFGIAQLVNHPKRVTTPLAKKDGRIIEITWDEALDFAASILKEYRDKTGVIFTPDLTLEAINALDTFTEIMGVEEFGAEINLPGEFETVCLKKPDKKVALIVLDFDLIQDFSVFLLKIKKSLDDNPVIIVIDSVQTKIAEKADVWLRPNPGMEYDLLEVLLSSEKAEDFAGVEKQTIIEARKLISKREVCILYNPNNLKIFKMKENWKVFPLFSNPNLAFLNKAKINRAIDILNKEHIECLYLIGVTIPENRRYKKIIVQDCFLPDFDFDLFLPSAIFPEIEGTFIDITGKEKKLQKAIEPMGNARPDDWIIKNIIERANFEFEKNETRSAKHQGYTEVKVDSTYPFYFVVRENAFRFRNKALSEILKGFKRLIKDDKIWMNPEDAKKLNIEDGEKVKIIAKDFETEMEVLVTNKIPPGMVFTYYNPKKGLYETKAVRIECLK